MGNKIDEMLNDTIAKEINAISLLESGSEAKSSAVDDLTKLYELKLEEAKIEQAKSESNVREKQVKSQTLAQWGGVAAQVACTIFGIIAYDVWNRRGLKFEETGVVGSSITRNLFSRMIPRIKG